MAENEDDPVVTTRVPREWLERADALAAVLAQNEDVRAFARPTRSMIVRLSLLRGLEVLEKTYGTTAPATSPEAAGPATSRKGAAKKRTPR